RLHTIFSRDWSSDVCSSDLSLIGVMLHEQVIARLTQVAVILGATSAVAVLALMVANDRPYVAVEVGNWVAIPAQDFHFHLKFDLDRKSVRVGTECVLPWWQE